MELPILYVAEDDFHATVMFVRELKDLAARGGVFDAQTGGRGAAFDPHVAENAAPAVTNDQIRLGLATSGAAGNISRSARAIGRTASAVASAAAPASAA